ncbi:hypothetical protein MLD38_010402 [Melastoma candidum]|nr:hypothetical protein MLD38_010402 [Melastoma candidum]
MKGESMPSSNPNQDWQHQNDVPMGSKSDAAAISHKYNSGSGSCIDPFQLKQSSPFLTPQHCSLFLMDGIVDPVHSQQTRRFIDAWPNVDDGSGNREMSSYGPSLGKNDLATSSLTLTMCGGEGDEYNNRIGEKPHWMNAGMVHHGSWMGSTPGGPLAEALCLGTIAGGGGVGVRYQASSCGCSSTTTATTTSSRSSGKDEGQEEFNFIG